MTGDRRLLYIAVLAILGIGWGSTQSLGKIAVSTGHGHFGLIFWQLVVGAVVLGAIAALRRRPLPLTRESLLFALVIALIGTIIPNSSFYAAVAHLPAGIMAILISTVPILAFPIALALRSERFSIARLAGLLVGLAGVIVIALPQAGLPAATALAWIPLAMVGPLFYAIEGNVVARWGTVGLDPVQAMFAASAVGAVAVLPLVLMTGQWISPPWPLRAAEQALVLSSVIHAFMYTGYVWLAASAGAIFATQTSYIVTAAGIGWAMLLLGERFGPLVFLSAALMACGLWLVRPERPRQGLEI